MPCYCKIEHRVYARNKKFPTDVCKKSDLFVAPFLLLRNNAKYRPSMMFGTFSSFCRVQRFKKRSLVANNIWPSSLYGTRLRQLAEFSESSFPFSFLDFVHYSDSRFVSFKISLHLGPSSHFSNTGLSTVWVACKALQS
jgi:hypothetical protein